MRTDIITTLKKFTTLEGVLMGVVSTEVLNTKAPIGFRPMDIMPSAKSVLVFAKPLPLAVFLVPNRFNNIYYQRAAYMYYLLMDRVADGASMILQEEGHLSLPIPSYSPLRFHEGEPRGVISLKHAAAEAGLGVIGRNTLLINRKYGNIMRLGALMTEMEWPEYSSNTDYRPCPEGCFACESACPIGAIKESGLDKIACLGRCIKHTMLPPSFMLPVVKKVVARSKMLTRFMELISLNFFETYGIGCLACLIACPHFPGKKEGGQ